MKLIDYKNDDLKSTNYNDYPLNITEASNHQLAFLILKFLTIVEKIYLEETGETKPPPSHSVAVIPTHLVNPVADIYLYIMRPTEKTSTPFSLFRMPKKKKFFNRAGISEANLAKNVSQRSNGNKVFSQSLLSPVTLLNCRRMFRPMRKKYPFTNKSGN